MKDEMLACFDEHGNEIQPHLRSEALAEPFPNYYHATANVWVIDKDGKMLCSQRSELVSANKLKWQSKFGGHVQAGDSFVQSAARELYEESGIEVVPEDLILIDHHKYEPHKHFSNSFMLLFNPDKHHIKLKDGEVKTCEWFTFDQYNQDRTNNPEKWTNHIDLESQTKILNILKNL
jgi:ADP-ribose pyrophosphatase YjhB (NUDIX family)